MRRECARLSFRKVRGFGPTEIGRRVVRASHGHCNVLRGHAAGIVVQLHGVIDGDRLAGGEIVEREIGRR